MRTVNQPALGNRFPLWMKALVPSSKVDQINTRAIALVVLTHSLPFTPYPWIPLEAYTFKAFETIMGRKNDVLISQCRGKAVLLHTFLRCSTLVLV